MVLLANLCMAAENASVGRQVRGSIRAFRAARSSSAQATLRHYVGICCNNAKGAVRLRLRTHVVSLRMCLCASTVSGPVKLTKRRDLLPTLRPQILPMPRLVGCEETAVLLSQIQTLGERLAAMEDLLW